MNNLYKIRNSENGAVVAFITSRTKSLAVDQYYANGGKCAQVVAEQMSWGYPHDLQTILG